MSAVMTGSPAVIFLDRRGRGLRASDARIEHGVLTANLVGRGWRSWPMRSLYMVRWLDGGSS